MPDIRGIRLKNTGGKAGYYKSKGDVVQVIFVDRLKI
jgi:hypothetical protein